MTILRKRIQDANSSVSSTLIDAAPKNNAHFSRRYLSSLLAVTLCIAAPATLAASSDFKDKVVLSEIMYHPSELAGNNKLEYLELFNATGDDANPTQNGEVIDLSGWEFTDGIKFSFSDNTLLQPGEYIVIAADETLFRETYDPSYSLHVANRTGKGWKGGLSNSGEEIVLVDGSSREVDAVEYGDSGIWSQREKVNSIIYYNKNGAEKDWDYQVDPENAPGGSWVVGGQWQGWDWSAKPDGGGHSIELVNPNGKNGNGLAWEISAHALGTPGAQNSNYAVDVAPLIEDLTQSPVIPSSADDVIITAKVKDDLGNIANVTLNYCIDNGSQHCSHFQSIAMTVDGKRYTAVIPAQADKKVLEYYIQAVDTSGNIRTLPEAAEISTGVFAQQANALYQVNNSFSDLSDSDIELMPRYYSVLKGFDQDQLADIGKIKQWDAKVNTEMNASFANAKVFDGAVELSSQHTLGMRIRGSSSRLQAVKSYKLSFPAEQAWDGRDSIMFNAVNPQKQHIGSVLYRNAGLPVSKTELVKFHVNAANLQSSAAYGNYVSVWDLETAITSSDDGGNLYKIKNIKEYATKKADLSLNSIADSTAMKAVYKKESNKDELDYSDIVQLVTEISSGDRTHINVEQWLKYIAFDSMMGNDETGIATGVGDDYALYRGEDDLRFILVARDHDSIFETAVNRSRIKGYSDFPGFSFMNLGTSSSDTKALYNIYRDLLSTTFNSTTLDPIIDAELSGKVSASAISRYKTFISDRAASLKGKLNSVLTDDITTDMTIAGEWTVASEIKVYKQLTMTPGTTIKFANNGRLTAQSGGKIVAKGTPERHITLTSSGSDSWNGVGFYGSERNNILSYVDMVNANSRNKPSTSYTSSSTSARKYYNDYLKNGYNIKVKDSRLLIDHMTWSGTKVTILEIQNSSVIVRDSIFPTVDENETVHGTGLPADGFLVFEGNTFGTTTGYSDVIDFTGGKLPNSIIQIHNNRFIGGSDDGLDFDNTDAYIAGNIFSGFHKQNSSSSTSNAVATDGETVGNATEITLVNNLFYNNDHHVVLKGRASIKVAGADIDSDNYSRNNLFYNANIAAINLGEPERGVRAGSHIAMKNSMFANNAINFQNLYYEKSGDNSVQKQRNFDNSLFYASTFDSSTNSSKVLDNITGEITGQPLFTDVANANFQLLADSAGKNAGTDGADIGPKVLPKLAVTEIMYNPDGDDADYEFIEIKNIGEFPVDLTQLQLQIKGDLALNFADASFEHAFSSEAPAQLLGLDQYAVIVVNVAEFKDRYVSEQSESDGNYIIVGTSAETMKNSGANITISDNNENPLIDFDYQDLANSDHSLVLIDETLGHGTWYTDSRIQAVQYDTGNKYNKANSWQSSATVNGSAGRQDANSSARARSVNRACGTQAMYLRGSFNAWGNLAMSCNNGIWMATGVAFDSGDASPRFKFDATGDWVEYFGDDTANYADNVVVRNGFSVDVSAEVYDITFDFFRKKMTVERNVGNRAPVAVAGTDIQLVIGEEAQFIGSGSYDSDGSIASYEWSNGLSGETASQVYPDLGTFSVTLTVTDNEGLSSTNTLVVTVTDGSEPLQSNFNQVYLRGTFNGWGTSSMELVADNTWQSTVIFTGNGNERFKFDILGDWSENYGDNEQDGTAEDRSGDNIQVTTGSYTITFNDVTYAYTVINNGGNVAPTANASSNQAISMGDTVTIDGSASIDPDGNIVSYNWSNGETSQSFVQTFDVAGEFSFSLTVTDDEGATSTDTVTITVTDPSISYTSNFDQLYIRGTNNGWGNTEMVLVADNTWQAEVEFGSASDERFKFDVYGDWSFNIGDNNDNGWAKKSEDDIAITQGAGTYRIIFNDSGNGAYQYSIVKL